MNKKLLILIFISVFLFSFISSAPPQETATGFYVRSGVANTITLNENYDAHVHVFDYDTGLPIITGISCYLHLYNETGHHICEMEDNTASHDFDYSFDISSGNFSTIGTRQIIIQCNNSEKGGFFSEEIIVNGYGEQITEGISLNFNFAMIFLMILFVMAIIGLFSFENPSGKLAFYWVAHILFVIGTFSVWQFNEGYGIAYVGLAGIFKVLFYVSATAIFPMVILSMAWIIYYHTMNEHMQKMMDKGMSPEEAFARAKEKKRKW